MYVTLLSSTCFGLDMPILRKNNCTNTASGILALLSGCTLHRCGVQPLRKARIPDAVFVQLFFLRMGMSRPKHVEDNNVTYMLILNCALKLVEEIILYYDARSKKYQSSTEFPDHNHTQQSWVSRTQPIRSSIESSCKFITWLVKL